MYLSSAEENHDNDLSGYHWSYPGFNNWWLFWTVKRLMVSFFLFFLKLFQYIKDCIMIKIVLKGRKQSDAYLGTIHRHCWSAQMMMKKIIINSASTVAFISLPLQLMKATVLAEISILYSFSSSSVHSSDVYEQQSSRH